MKKNVQLYQDNKITQARYEFSVVEKRLIYKIIEKIRNNYILTDKGDKDLFGDLDIRLTDRDLRGLNTSMKDVYASMRTLKTRFYEYDNDERWQLLGIVNEVEHKKKQGVWRITVGKNMVDKFAELARNYTAYSLTVAMSLRSEYSQRFYEYCSQYRQSGGWQMSMEDLRFKLKLEEKYIRYASFKKYVLDKAQKELKDIFDKGESDLYFNYSEIKEGRKVIGFRFKIIRSKDIDNELKEEDLLFHVRNELNAIFQTSTKKKNKQFVDETITKLIINTDLLKHCYEKITFVKSAIPPQEQARYMRFIINEDYLKKQ